MLFKQIQHGEFLLIFCMFLPTQKFQFIVGIAKRMKFSIRDFFSKCDQMVQCGLLQVLWLAQFWKEACSINPLYQIINLNNKVLQSKQMWFKKHVFQRIFYVFVKLDLWTNLLVFWERVFPVDQEFHQKLWMYLKLGCLLDRI